MEREGGQAALSDIEENPFLFEELLGLRTGAQPLVSSPVREKTQREKTHVSALPFSLPLALHSLGLLALLVLHRLVDGPVLCFSKRRLAAA